MIAFNNIPVCDAIYKTSDVFQTPVDLELDGPVPEQGFFTIQKGWSSESSFTHSFGLRLAFYNPRIL